MARRKKRPLSKEAKRQRRRSREQAQLRDDVVSDTAARFTCAAETADDFDYQCEHALAELEINLRFNRLALEIWNQPPAGAEPLLAALQELLAERLRHRETLQRLAQQLQRLAHDPAMQIHLESVEDYQELVRSRLFAPSPAK